MKLTRKICWITELADVYHGDKELYFSGGVDLSFMNNLDPDFVDDGLCCLDMNICYGKAVTTQKGKIAVDFCLTDGNGRETWFTYDMNVSEQNELLLLITDYLGCSPEEYFEKRK